MEVTRPARFEHAYDGALAAHTPAATPAFNFTHDGRTYTAATELGILERAHTIAATHDAEIDIYYGGHYCYTITDTPDQDTDPF